MTVNFEGGDHVHVGDHVTYRVSTQKAGYHAIFEASPDGKRSQVYPNTRSLAAPGICKVALMQGLTKRSAGGATSMPGWSVSMHAYFVG